MIIDCPDCKKKFNIEQNLIPDEGRLLQCGNCDHKWFFNPGIFKKKEKEKIVYENVETSKEVVRKEINYPSSTTNDKSEKISSHKKKEKKNVNYLNILMAIIISSVAFILILDTFKNQLVNLFPNINFLLDNLYQSILDIKLFVLDLIN